MTTSITEDRLATLGFTKANYARSRGLECTDRSYTSDMFILALKELTCQEQPVMAPGFWDTHTLSVNCNTGTFRVDTKAPSFVEEASRTQPGASAAISVMTYNDYLRWNPDAGRDPPVTTVQISLSRKDIEILFKKALLESSKLPEESLSSVEKILLQKELKDFARSLGIELEAPCKTTDCEELLVLDSEMAEPEKIELPLSICKRSQFFKILIFSPMQGPSLYHHGSRAAAPRVHNLTLPDQFTLDAFKLYMLAALDKPLPQGLTNADLALLVELCDYFEDDETAEKIGEQFSTSTNFLETIHELLANFEKQSTHLSSKCLQRALSAYVNKSISHTQTPGRSLRELLSALRDVHRSPLLPQEYELLTINPLKLSLHGNFSNDDLEQLSILFPSVESLDISCTAGISAIPEIWNHSLKYLNISCSEISAIDYPLPNLEVLNANRAQLLTNIEGLNGLTLLREIDISHTQVAKAPLGCSSLERFDAAGVRTLTDTTGLNGLVYLKELLLDSTSISTAPTGCTSLEKFSAHMATQLADITALENNTRLRELNISSTAVRAAPKGCKALEVFKADYATLLSEIEGLNGLTFLREINVSGTAVRAAPIGCYRLNSFNASNAKAFANVSGLNFLRELRDIDISKTAITEAPKGCTSLTTFIASKAESLCNVESLLSCPKLTFAVLPDHIQIKEKFINFNFLRKIRSNLIFNTSGQKEKRIEMFNPLNPHIKNRLKWGFWLFSGMPEGDPEFGTHLFEENPLDPAVNKTLAALEDFGNWNFIPYEEVEKINDLQQVLQDPKASSQDKLKAFDQLSVECKTLILHSIWVKCGSDLSADPEFAEKLVKENPDSPLIKEVVARLVRELSS